MYCTDHAFFLNSRYWVSELHPALSMHSIDLALFPNSHCCIFELYFAIFMHCTVPLLILAVNIGHSSLILLFLCIPQTSSTFLTIIFANWGFIQTLLTICTINIEYLSSILHFLCITQTLLSFSTVNIGIRAPSSPFYAFHRPGSLSQQSFLHI